jgi:hypothetical protein
MFNELVWYFGPLEYGKIKMRLRAVLPFRFWLQGLEEGNLTPSHVPDSSRQPYA